MRIFFFVKGITNFDQNATAIDVMNDPLTIWHREMIL